MSASPQRILHVPFSLGDGPAERAAIGLVVLATDVTVEHEWHEIVRLPGVATHTARMHNAPETTAATLAAMECDLAAAAALIRPGERVDVVGFACTAGAMIIGEEKVFARIHEVRPGVACTTPITAALAAIERLDARRVALLTPYSDDVNEWMAAYIEARGAKVTAIGSFHHGNDNEVSRIDSSSLEQAVIELGKADVDAVFASCTSLRLASLADRLEAHLGKAVFSSNLAFVWHALRLAGIADPIRGWGRLLTR